MLAKVAAAATAATLLVASVAWAQESGGPTDENMQLDWSAVIAAVRHAGADIKELVQENAKLKAALQARRGPGPTGTPPGVPTPEPAPPSAAPPPPKRTP